MQVENTQSNSTSELDGSSDADNYCNESRNDKVKSSSNALKYSKLKNLEWT